MIMEEIKLNKEYSLDLGALAPVVVKTIEFRDDGVVCEYKNSHNKRTETLSYKLFEINGITKKFEIPETPLTKDIRHLNEEREYKINHLKDTLELNFSEDTPRKELEEILKINRRLKLLEDQLVVSRVKENEK